MEETQPRPMPAHQEVSFPQPKEPGGRGSNVKIIIAVVGVILIVLVGGWLILGNSSGGSETPSSTPDNGLSTFPSPNTTTPTPDTSPSASPVAKSEVKLEVLNGTGVPGEASFLQDELEKLGFENIEVGNADEQDAKETVATYSREISPEVADEITARLEELYETVRTRRATVSGDFDISITTGPRKGGSATASPKASAKPTATSTASPKTSATPTPTASN